MRRTLTTTVVFSILAVLGMGAQHVSAAPVTVVNSGFEDPAITTGTYVFDSTTLPGWTVPAGNIDILTSAYWQPHSGNQSIDLYGCAAGTIRQQITTVAGYGYTLTYWVAGNADSEGLRSSVVSVGSSAGAGDLGLKPETFDTTGKTKTNMGWEQRSLAFTAAGASSWIQFNDTTSSTCQGIALDDVAVVETSAPPVVPEVPYAVMLPLSALLVAGAGYGLRRRVA